jgi:hypothetical protein
MSDRTVLDRIDTLPTRMLDVIDGLPVPAGPGRLRPRRTLVARIDPVPLIVLLLIAAVASLATPLGRDAVGEAAKWFQRMLIAPSWTLYYNDLGARDASGLPAERLMFAAGALPAIPARPELLTRDNIQGGWSADGELAVIATGSKVLVGDRNGWLREVADLGGPVGPIRWTGRREIAAAMRTDPRGGIGGVARIDIVTGRIERYDVPDELKRLPGGQVYFSPDGRWLVWDERPVGCGAVLLYEVGTSGVVTLSDGKIERGNVAGWLRDGRIVTSVCDIEARETRVFVSRPGDPRGTPIAILRRWPRDPFGRVDAPRDRILQITGDPGELRVVSIELDGRVSELVRLPAVSETSPGVVSRDGRFFSFLAFDRSDPDIVPGRPALTRVGVVDLVTGSVIWACDNLCGGPIGLR